MTALRIALHRAWIVLLSLAVALGSAYGVTRTMEPRYEATATVFVGSQSSSGDPGLDLAYTTAARELAASYAELAKTRSVAEAAAQKAGVSAGRLIGQVATEAQPGLHVLKLRVAASSATVAARLANAVAETVAERVSSLNSNGSRTFGTHVTVIDPALPPKVPVSPRRSVNLLFGGLAGLFVGFGLAVAAERLDRRIRSGEEAERVLGLPVVGIVPAVPARRPGPDAIARHRDEHVGEPHRSLALAFASDDDEIETPRRILLTSPVNGEDTAGIAAHLGLALAEQDRSTALIEVDLRRPALGRHFRSNGAASLEDLLSTRVQRLPKSTLVAPKLNVVTARDRHADAAAILRSTEFERTLAAAAREHDHVLLAGPPALSASDAGILARHADTVLLVVRTGKTRIREVQAVTKTFGRLGVEIAGVVLVNGGALRRLHGLRPSLFVPASQPSSSLVTWGEPAAEPERRAQGPARSRRSVKPSGPSGNGRTPRSTTKPRRS